ncbi:hypothetical protein GCM10027176_56950 [Actinoallomurus bryophytorum]|uniref:SnoaL-like protein n=1 Tax=Actinoallomurus bryophytorum TaxID=1490222 RepID=A0A543C0J9_9ACTN|nr:SnoaL-like protein [Actinoallomurus bryophytorum]
MVERLVEGVSHVRWDELPGLYAEDAVVMHPLDRAGPLTGREALRRHFAAAAGRLPSLVAAEVRTGPASG